MKFSKTNQFPGQLERDRLGKQANLFSGGWLWQLGAEQGRGGERESRAEGRREREKKSLFLFPDAAWAEQPVLIAAYRWFCMFGLSRADKWPALAAADSLLFSKWRSWWGHVMTPRGPYCSGLSPTITPLTWWPSTAEEVNHSLGQKYRRGKKKKKNTT